MKVFLMVAIACVASAADPPAKPAVPLDPGANIVLPAAADPELAAKLAATEQELRLVKLENIARQKDAMNAAIAKLDADAQLLAEAACRAAGIEPNPKVCVVDINAKTVTKRPPETKTQ